MSFNCIPSLRYRDPKAAVEFLQSAFGFLTCRVGAEPVHGSATLGTLDRVVLGAEVELPVAHDFILPHRITRCLS